MNKMIDIDELFELNPDYEVVSFDGEVMIVDNWYKNYDQIIEVMKKQTPITYTSDGAPEISEENGKEYFDGRVIFPNSKFNKKYLKSVEEILKLINTTPDDVHFETNALIFNYWKSGKIYENKFQSRPHTDGTNTFACVIYLDELCSGGTAFYKSKEKPSSGSGLIDIQNITVEQCIELKRVIPAKPNRMIIYEGNTPHGAFIEDHSKYIDEWRINHVHFIHLHNNDNNKE